MAFQFSNEGTPYYRAPAPEVPVAPREPQGERLGGNILSAMTQMALARERAKIEEQQNLLTADLQAKRLGFEREHLAQTYDLTTRAQDIQQQNTLLDYSVAKDRVDMEGDWHEAQTDLSNRQFKTAYDRNLAFARSQAKTIDDAGKDSLDLGLFDSEKQTKNPMQWLADFERFSNRYANAPDVTRIPETISNLKKTVADKLTVALDTGNGTKNYPLQQVYEGLKDPNSPFWPAFKQSGYFTQGSVDKKGGAKGVKAPTKEFSDFMEQGRKADFEGAAKEKSRIDPLAPRNATEAIAAGTLTPDGSGGGDTATPAPNPMGTKSGQLNPGAQLPPPEVSEEETDANYVKGLLAQHPEKAEDLKAVFYGKFPNADPNLFNAAQ